MFHTNSIVRKVIRSLKVVGLQEGDADRKYLARENVLTVAGIAPSPQLSPKTLLSLSVCMGLWAAAAVTTGLDSWVPIGACSLVFRLPLSGLSVPGVSVCLAFITCSCALASVAQLRHWA